MVKELEVVNRAVTTRPKSRSKERLKAAFLERFSQYPNYTAVAEELGVRYLTVYKWREKDPAFAAACTEAYERGLDALEDEAIRRAQKGVEEPVFHDGEVVGYKQKYSDELMKFMLAARRKTVFKNSTTLEHTGPGGGPMQIRNLTDEELDARIAQFASAAGVPAITRREEPTSD